MKTKTTIIAILMILLANNVFAVKNFKLEVKPIEESKVLINTVTKAGAKSSLDIVSESGETVYFKKLKKNDLNKQVFNLSNLEDGKYEVRLSNAKMTLKNEMTICNGVVTVMEQNQEIEPHFSFENDVIKISYLNFEKDKVQAMVYQSGVLIHEAYLGNEFTVNKGLNLSRLKKGKYDLCLTNGNRQYWFSVAR